MTVHLAAGREAIVKAASQIPRSHRRLWFKNLKLYLMNTAIEVDSVTVSDLIQAIDALQEIQTRLD